MTSEKTSQELVKRVTPTVFVLDHKGLIRYRQIGIPDKKAIDEVLNKLIKEAEANDKRKSKPTGNRKSKCHHQSR